jgi:hypothetical protein
MTRVRICRWFKASGSNSCFWHHDQPAPDRGVCVAVAQNTRHSVESAVNGEGYPTKMTLCRRYSPLAPYDMGSGANCSQSIRAI